MILAQPAPRFSHRHRWRSRVLRHRLLPSLYVWDKAGNLNLQTKEGRYAETFTYDSLNRLTEVRMTLRNDVTANQVMLAHVYDALGNLCRKAEWGESWDYGYVGRAGCGTGGLPGSSGTGVVGPHQVGAQAADVFFYYDSQGNQTLTDLTALPDRTVSYNAANQACEILVGTVAAPGKRLRFWYGPDGQRYKQEEAGKKTLYVGGVEIVVQGAGTTYRRYVAGAMLQTVTGGTAVNKYLFQDQLGSLVRIANADGTVSAGLDYSAYGVLKDYANPDNPWVTMPSTTPRGYTGHEMLDGTGVIHMNGRIYNASLGRFLQPDPVVQSPGSAQSWNAYSYVFNNPLNATDPTGMFSWGHAFFNPLSSVVRGVMSGMSSTAHGLGLAGCSAIPAGWGIACAAGANYDYSRANGGSVSDARKAGVNAAFSAAVSFGIGKFGGGMTRTRQFFVSGMAGGITAELGGGKFGNGFLAAGLTTLAMPNLGDIQNDMGRTVAGTIIGGTISEATGGKFANGAITGAFQAAMIGVRKGGEGHRTARGKRDAVTVVRDSQVARAVVAESDMAMADIYGRPYESIDTLALDIDQRVPAIADKFSTEVGLRIFEESGFYYAGDVVSNGEICTSSNVCGVQVNRSLLNGEVGRGRLVGDYHTHPTYSLPGFSWGDIVSTYPRSNYTSYVSHSGVGLYALDWSNFSGYSADQIYHYQKYRVLGGGK